MWVPESFEPKGPWRSTIYDDLRRLAKGALAAEAPGHSLQVTLLANDAYLKLAQQRNIDPSNHSQLRAAGAVIIRRLLVDYARARRAEKRGGGRGGEIPLHILIADSAKPIELLEFNEALEAFEQHNPRAARVVDLKFFGGLSGDEIAAGLGVSLRTVNIDWRFAKAWLYRALS